MSSLPRDSISSIPRDLLLIYAFNQHHSFQAVNLLKLHLNDFTRARLYQPADVTRFNGKFAMSTVNQHQKLHARWAAMIEQSVKRGSNRSARIKNVVHQNDIFAGYWKFDLLAMQNRTLRDRRQIVSI